MALFGKGAPPLTLLRSFETARPHRASSGGPAGLLRANERNDGTPVPQGERPTTLAGHPEEARFFRAVSKDQGERSRKRIYEMLDLGRVSKTKELRKGACGGPYGVKISSPSSAAILHSFRSAETKVMLSRRRFKAIAS